MINEKLLAYYVYFILGAVSIRVYLWLFDMQELVRDAGFCFVQTMAGYIAVELLCSLRKEDPRQWLAGYLAVIFLAWTAYIGYKFLPFPF